MKIDKDTYANSLRCCIRELDTGLDCIGQIRHTLQTALSEYCVARTKDPLMLGIVLARIPDQLMHLEEQMSDFRNHGPAYMLQKLLECSDGQDGDKDKDEPVEVEE